MQAIRVIVTAALIMAAAITSSSFAADLVRPTLQPHRIPLFTVVNATYDSVTALAMAPASSGSFEDIALGGPLTGGMTSTTVTPPGGECLRDIRVTFRDGQSQVIPGIDVCRSHVLRLGVLRR